MKSKLSKLSRLTVLGLCLGILISVFIFQVQAAEPENSSASVTERRECEGFDTPEEAITAFCEALKEYDFEKALSTFALESYCENYDYAGFIERLRAFQPVSINIISPAENDLSMNLNTMKRISDIAAKITTPLQMIAFDNMVLFSEDENIKQLADALRSYQLYKADELSYSELKAIAVSMQQYPDFSNVEISEPLSPLKLGALNPSYLSLNNLNNIFLQDVIAGASGAAEMGIIMEDKRNIYLVVINTVKYGDKWYNYSLGGNFMILMSIPVSRSGIIGGSKENFDELDYDLITAEDLQTLFDASFDQSSHVPTDEELSEFRQTFEEEHAVYAETMETEAKANGLVYDPETSWFDQIDVLKELAEKKGETFYSTNYIKITAMSYDEMKHYFTLEDDLP